MSKKICINKKIFFIISLVIVIFFLSLLTNSILKSKTTYKSEAASAAIYGGTEVTDPKKWPFMVRLYSTSWPDTNAFNGGYCDGTLIAPRWVLTAGHCGKKISLINDRIFIGTNDLKTNVKTYKIKKFYIHPNFEFKFNQYMINDIALVELDEEIKDIPTISINKEPSFQTEGEGVMAAILGWGSTRTTDYPNKLELAVAPVLLNETANQTDWLNGLVPPSELAIGYPLGGVGQCAGDSGGPNIVWAGNKWVQISIISWSYKYYCDNAKQPGIGTRLSYQGMIYGKYVNYIQWIKDTIKNETGEVYTGDGTFKGNDLTYSEKSEFIKRIWINQELETASLKPH